MGAQLGNLKVGMKVGGSSAKSRNEGTTLTWKFEDGQFLFSLNNINPTLATLLSENTSSLTLGVIRYQTKKAQRHSRSAVKRKTTPQGASLSISMYAPNYQNMNITALIENWALNDNNHFRKTSKRATSRTAEILGKNWRDYGFGIIITGPSRYELIFESHDVLRVYLLNQQSEPTQYQVVNKKEIEVW